MNNLDKPRKKVRTPKNQWQTPGQVTDINSRFITMNGVGFDAVGVGADGTKQYMENGKNYYFPVPPVREFPMMRNGGGLLSRSVTCSNCGWSWKAVDGGKDPFTCHNCGGMVKMQNGGSLPKYQVAGPIDYSRRNVSESTNSGITNRVAKQIAVQAASNQKAEQDVQTLIKKAGYSEPHARRAVRNKTDAQANKFLEDNTNKDYRIQMHPDFDPNKSTDEQSHLLYDNSLRTRLLRGSNMMTNSGIPELDFVGGAFTLPGRSFVNMTMDADKRYFNSQNGVLGNIANLAEDVVNVYPSVLPKAAGVMTKVPGVVNQGARTAGNYLTTQTPLRNAYKINPFAEKLRNPNKSYRVAGLDAYEDFIESGVLRSKTPMSQPGMSMAEKMKLRTTGFPSFQKGFADLYYLRNKPGVVFETSLPTYRRGEINPVTGEIIKGRHYAHRVIDPKTGKTLYSIPAFDVKVFETTPHWLKGYKEVPTVYSDIRNMNSKNFGKYIDFLNDVSMGEGAHNLGIYPMKRDQRFLFKVSADRKRLGLDGYEPEDMVELTKDLDPSVFSRVYKNIELDPRDMKRFTSAGNRKLGMWQGDNNKLSLSGNVLNRLEGRTVNNIPAEEITDIPQTTYQQYLDDIRDLDKRGIAFDVFGDNILYDAAKKRFKLLDLESKKGIDPFRDPFKFNAFPYSDVKSVDGNRSRVLNEAMIKEHLNKKLRSQYINDVNSEAKMGTFSDEEIYKNFMDIFNKINSIKKYGGIPQYQYAGSVRIPKVEGGKRCEIGSNADNSGTGGGGGGRMGDEGGVGFDAMQMQLWKERTNPYEGLKGADKKAKRAAYEAALAENPGLTPEMYGMADYDAWSYNSGMKNYGKMIDPTTGMIPDSVVAPSQFKYFINNKLIPNSGKPVTYKDMINMYNQMPGGFNDGYKQMFMSGFIPKKAQGGQHGGLDRWFAEKWVDVKTGKACGRQEGESRAGYPACRPSRRVNEDTPKTASELSSAEREKFKRSKTSSERINYQHRRKEYGGEQTETDMANKPNNPSLWSKAKSLAKQKFDVYPSAYANGWAAKWYKGKGGTWRKAEYGMEIPMMAEGGKPDWLLEAQLKAQGYSGNALQQKMSSMAQGGEPQNAGFQALPEYVQNKIMEAAYGGYIPEVMAYGGPAQQAAIAIAMKKAGKKPKKMAEGGDPTLEQLMMMSKRPGQASFGVGYGNDKFSTDYNYAGSNNFKNGTHSLNFSLPSFLKTGNLGINGMYSPGQSYSANVSGNAPANFIKKGATLNFSGGYEKDISPMIRTASPSYNMAAGFNIPTRAGNFRINASYRKADGGMINYPMMDVGGEPNGEMALGQMAAVSDKMAKLLKFIKPDENLDPWIASKLAVMDHSADAIYDYMTYGAEGDEEEMEAMKNGGGVPQRYKNMGFTKVGVKKNSTRPGKKWMVLAKKGSDYKVVHGGYDGMKDFSQHHSEKRKDKFWSRMGGKNSAKAKDPFSPLYWHKRFGTWQDGGELDDMPSVEEIIQAYADYSSMSVEAIVKELRNMGEEEQQQMLVQMYQELTQADQEDLPNNMTQEDEEEPIEEEESEVPEQQEIETKASDDDDDDEKVDYSMVFANGGYIGFDGKRYPSKTPTWSGNTGYAMGGYIPEMMYGSDMGMGGTPCYNCGGKVYKTGGGININPANKGKFTASAKRAGMGVQQFASHVLANKEDYSSTQVKRANFARNAAKWNKQEGGPIVGDEMDVTPEQLEQLRAQGYEFEII